ncbi:hypothetical protein Tsubulata_006768 [Turnera subulata]|uniref:DUF4283 domain-containing protein n=1 Tax=Turnera subulata TaxID=218843 RepID=A0A9Q0JEP4_9ROSI|nr:hypothetical protein Tsubulata_006768 [Turnera subulata]
MGGVSFSLCFPSPKALLDFNPQNHPQLTDFFDLFRPWQAGDITHNRLCWVSIKGVPVHAWSKEFFNLLAIKFGKLIDLSPQTRALERLDVAEVLILTSNRKLISAESSVKIGDHSFGITMCENLLNPLEWNWIQPPPAEPANHTRLTNPTRTNHLTSQPQIPIFRDLAVPSDPCPLILSDASSKIPPPTSKVGKNSNNDLTSQPQNSILRDLAVPSNPSPLILFDASSKTPPPTSKDGKNSNTDPFNLMFLINKTHEPHRNTTPSPLSCASSSTPRDHSTTPDKSVNLPPSHIEPAQSPLPYDQCLFLGASSSKFGPLVPYTPSPSPCPSPPSPLTPGPPQNTNSFSSGYKSICSKTPSCHHSQSSLIRDIVERKLAIILKDLEIQKKRKTKSFAFNGSLVSSIGDDDIMNVNKRLENVGDSLAIVPFSFNSIEAAETCNVGEALGWDVGSNHQEVQEMIQVLVDNEASDWVQSRAAA